MICSKRIGQREAIILLNSPFITGFKPSTTLNCNLAIVQDILIVLCYWRIRVSVFHIKSTVVYTYQFDIFYSKRIGANQLSYSCLATNKLNLFIKDHNQNMWFGSYTGLHKHEGAYIKVYNRLFV